MGLETATYINGLNVSWPDGAVDPRSEGDDHLRLIKAALKNTFPNITGAMTASHTELNYMVGVTSNIQTQLNTRMPAGGIILWSGAAAAIPSGWLICDGTNGTPDLRSRFVVGASASGGYAVGASGGSADAVVVSHTHTATSTDAGHAHTQTAYQATGGGFNAASAVNANWVNTPTDVGYAAISTTVNSTGVSGANANLPPYYALCYIMKS